MEKCGGVRLSIFFGCAGSFAIEILTERMKLGL